MGPCFVDANVARNASTGADLIDPRQLSCRLIDRVRSYGAIVWYLSEDSLFSIVVPDFVCRKEVLSIRSGPHKRWAVAWLGLALLGHTAIVIKLEAVDTFANLISQDPR